MYMNHVGNSKQFKFIATSRRVSFSVSYLYVHYADIRIKKCTNYWIGMHKQKAI